MQSVLNEQKTTAQVSWFWGKLMVDGIQMVRMQAEGIMWRDIKP